MINNIIIIYIEKHDSQQPKEEKYFTKYFLLKKILKSFKKAF